ncbi:MAG: phosphoribosylanthranilate isomerase [Mariniblastus sp.]|nr:phosphoribosylanthranilate isomerase [Mariniblastus sp.]
MEDARSASELGVEAIGLNFYPNSRRHVTVERAAKIIQETDCSEVQWVGVFVNEPPEDLVKVSNQVGLDLIQLHGDESVGILEHIGMPVIRAVRVSDPVSAQREIDQWTSAGAAAILLDAASSGSFGGSGTVIDWRMASAFSCQVPLILAGGLTPSNVSEAIEVVRPAAVDVASGVESAPGLKDLELMREFLSKASFELGKNRL